MNIGCSSGGGAAGCGGTDGSMVGTGVGIVSSPFTVSQWQELELQALILKYLKAHLPVPPDLVFPIQRSLDSISPRYFHHPTVGYCSFYGKVVDPEPGRCRRTDGKKWRCSKEAYPDSKYCERHMHRGRNRSRKPVESSSPATSLTVSASSSSSSSLQAIPLQAYGNISSTAQSPFSVESIPYAIPSKDYRHKGASMEDQVDASWPPMEGRVAPRLFYGGDYGGDEGFKEEGQSMPRQFFDEWPKSREGWSGLEEDSPNQTSFSTTQLSMAIPRSPQDD